MIYMLDTNICIYVINKKPISYLQKLETLERNNTLSISSIVLAELQYGVANSYHQEQNQINLDIFLNKLEIIDFSAKCALYYGELRAKLKKEGVIIGNNNLLIASHAIASRTTLVTNNINEFKRIPNLILENWE
jgi:tRNA(fMet)-specific endonuclease VapC